jgi:5,6-dimethylbenzimidazole synthase
LLCPTAGGAGEVSAASLHRSTRAGTRYNRAMPQFDNAFRQDLLALFRWRRDVRRFRRDPLPADLLPRLLEMAAMAPSVGLSQPWRFVTVDEPARRAAVRGSFAACNAAALAGQAPDRAATYARLKLAGLDEAPCHLAIFAEPEPQQGHRLGRESMPEMAAYSAVIAAHTLWLAARAEGIGMGWVSILDPVAVTAALAVPDHWRLIGYFCLGYPQEEHDTPELERAGWEYRRPGAPELLRR